MTKKELPPLLEDDFGSDVPDREYDDLIEVGVWALALVIFGGLGWVLASWPGMLAGVAGLVTGRVFSTVVHYLTGRG